MSPQEVTSESYEMMRRSPWFSRYMASPFGMQSYDTAILYNKSDVTGARPFQKQPFDNSRMGRLKAQAVCFTSTCNPDCAPIGVSINL